MKKYTTLLTFIALLLYANESAAHAKLMHSNPEHQSVISDSPRIISLKFNQGVKLIKVELRGGSEAMKVKFIPTLKAKVKYSIPINSELQDGDYEVHWVGMGKDGHKMTGVIEFKIDKAEQ